MIKLPINLNKIISVVLIFFSIILIISFLSGIRNASELENLIYLTKDYSISGVKLFLKY